LSDIIGLLSHPALQGISAIIGIIAILVPVIVFIVKNLTRSNKPQYNKAPDTAKQPSQPLQHRNIGCTGMLIKMFLGAGFLVPLSTLLPPVFMILALPFLGNLDVFQKAKEALIANPPVSIEGVARFVIVLVLDLVGFLILLLFSYVYLARRGILYGMQMAVVFSGLATTIYYIFAAVGNRTPANLSYLLGISGLVGTLVSMMVVWATYYSFKKA
jgi:hypothetical protein